MLEHILIRLDQQLVVEIRIEIPPVRFTGSSIELNQVHKLTTWTFSVLLFKGHGTAGLFPKTEVFSTGNEKIRTRKRRSILQNWRES